MPISIDRLYPIIALALLAAGTLWLERATRSDEPRTASQVRQYPDFIGEHIRLTSFDPAGQQRYQLFADKATHYPLSDVTEFEQPDLRYDTAEGELHLSADRGESREGGETLLLRGNVRVLRDGRDGNPELTFASNSLRVWPDEQRAETDDPVVLTQGNTVAHGNGMRADNLFGTLQLIGDARVSMPPSSRN